MKVLWITNLLLPEARALLGDKSQLTSSGGWILGAAKMMASEKNVQLHIACPANVNHLIHLEGESIHYHLYSGPILHDWLWTDNIFNELYTYIRPDIIHIWGSEYPSAISAVRPAQKMELRVVISLQGLIHNYTPHTCDGLSLWSILQNGQTYRRGILREMYESYKKGKSEIQALRKVQNVIGRTQWDKAIVMKINPSLSYYHCDEILRSEFYEGRWIYANCEKYSLFHSNGTTPNKGLHQMLKALPIIKKKYPAVKLYVAGRSIWDMASEGDNYARIIVSMLKKYRLEDTVCFCGPLDAKQMKERMLKSNVFVLPSSIDNSSNALGEAQLLGVPVVASNRGGTPTMIPDGLCGKMYPYNSIKKLARSISDSFANSSQFDNTHMRDIARKRHNPQNNQKVLMDIYIDCVK